MDRALDREYFISVVGGRDEEDAALAQELRTFPAESVLYLGALAELSVSFRVEQGFRQAWQEDPSPCRGLSAYANSYEREAAGAPVCRMAENAPDTAGAVHHVVLFIAGRDGRDAEATRPFADRSGDCHLRRP